MAVVLNPSELVLNPSESVLVVPLRPAQEEYGQLAPDGEPAQVEDEVDKVHAETQHKNADLFDDDKTKEKPKSKSCRHKK